jgi:hypothetical protein
VTKDKPHNLPASVRQRLTNLARATKEDFLAVLVAAWHFGLNHVGSLRYELAMNSSVNGANLLTSRNEVEQPEPSAKQLTVTRASTIRLSPSLITPHDSSPAHVVERPVAMIGRVERHPSRAGQLIFDDGSGKAILDWQGEQSTWPEPGSVVLLRASELRLSKDGPLVVIGKTRFQIVPGQNSPSAVP